MFFPDICITYHSKRLCAVVQTRDNHCVIENWQCLINKLNICKFKLQMDEIVKLIVMIIACIYIYERLSTKKEEIKIGQR